MTKSAGNTLWGGRFSGGTDPQMWALNASIMTDRRLAFHDIRGSKAWVRALQRAGVLTEAEAQTLLDGLTQVAAEFAEGQFVFAPTDEDIHTAVERRLRELVGEVAGKLHTGRSRNDQVATDFRLWMLDAIDHLTAALADLQSALLARAESDFGTVMPGYTHLQQAQPVLLSHWWLSHFWPLQRDRERLAQARERTAALPLGAAALAGTAYPIDRQALAADLGFLSVIPNSIDAVSDRDFAAEFLFAAALLGVHLSRLAEGVILFSSAEFGFLTLSDAYSTGSSLMPQKKNPDAFELARGKSGALIGALTGLLATLKGLPSAYDKDLQEDKAPVFRAFDDLAALLPVLANAPPHPGSPPRAHRGGHRRGHVSHRPGRLPGEAGRAFSGSPPHHRPLSAGSRAARRGVGRAARRNLPGRAPGLHRRSPGKPAFPAGQPGPPHRGRRHRARSRASADGVSEGGAE